MEPPPGGLPDKSAPVCSPPAKAGLLTRAVGKDRMDFSRTRQTGTWSHGVGRLCSTQENACHPGEVDDI